MVRVTIRLIGEDEDVIFISEYIHIGDLVKRIESLTRIPPVFQQYRFRNEDHPFVAHPIQDIKLGEEIIVMHSDLEWWELYKQSADIALQPSTFKWKVTIRSLCRRKHTKRKATENHLLGQHFERGAEDEMDFVCRLDYCPENLGESRTRALAYVQFYGQKEETKYTIKNHRYCSPDIKEIFCYKLLERINVGPQAQFIVPSRFPEIKTSLYIATQWKNNFIPLSGDTEKAVSRFLCRSFCWARSCSSKIFTRKIVVSFFYNYLGSYERYLKSVSSKNIVDGMKNNLSVGNVLISSKGTEISQLEVHFGLKKTKKNYIVDFMPRAFFKFSNLKRALFNNNSSVCWESSHIEALEACDEATRMKVARKRLNKWNLLSKIDFADELIASEKNRMRHADSLTEELDQYISIIKQNITNLYEMLNASE